MEGVETTPKNGKARRVDMSLQLRKILRLWRWHQRAAWFTRGMKLPDGWHDIPAVRNGQVYALEANSYFSRPGPRLMTGLEILAKVLHPRVKVSREAEASIRPLQLKAHAAQA